MPKRPRNPRRGLELDSGLFVRLGEVQSSERTMLLPGQLVVSASSFFGSVEPTRNVGSLSVAGNTDFPPTLVESDPFVRMAAVFPDTTIHDVLGRSGKAEIRLTTVKCVAIDMVSDATVARSKTQNYTMEVELFVMDRVELSSMGFESMPIKDVQDRKVLGVNLGDQPTSQGNLFERGYACHAAPPIRCRPFPRAPHTRRGGSWFVAEFYQKGW